MKYKNLIKILGITTLLLIPQKINEIYNSKIEVSNQIKEINSKTLNKKSKENTIKYDLDEKYIKEEIYFLNQQRDFFKMRINQCDSLMQVRGNDSLYKLKEHYQSKLNEINKILKDIN